MKINMSAHIPAPPDQVARALCSEPFNRDVESQRDEVVSTEFVVVEETPERKVFEVRSTEYKRKKTGALDRSGTVQSVNRNRWDATARTLSWVYDGVGSNWVQVSGVYRLQAADGGTRLTHEVDIEVKIPLIGKQVAKFVAKEMNRAFERFPPTLERHL